jgi:hypothetical protein
VKRYWRNATGETLLVKRYWRNATGETLRVARQHVAASRETASAVVNQSIHASDTPPCQITPEILILPFPFTSLFRPCQNGIDFE